MSTHWLKKLVAGLIAGVLIALALFTFSAAKASTTFYYSVTDLGSGEAVDINDLGQVVGVSVTDGFLWKDGTNTKIGDLWGNYPAAIRINNKGQVTSTKITYRSNITAFFLENGVKTNLGTLNGAPTKAAGINNRGQVVGSAETDLGKQTWLWQKGTMMDVIPVQVKDFAPSAINDKTQIVGTVFRTTKFRTTSYAGLWENGNITPLAFPGALSSYAYDINLAGQVVGTAQVRRHPNLHAVLWENGKAVDLGGFGGDSYAYGINAVGKVVGRAETETGGRRAFLWNKGKMFDLNNLIAPDSGWFLSSANAINNRGQIVGTGGYHNQQRAFLLTPIRITQ